ncbi:MAG: histidine kinase [Clostridiales Family XIII bacterium]|jgi:signal transduction histidine kinase|nr:histidine kinase [Clostridiales Family XIII bacterium]
MKEKELFVLCDAAAAATVGVWAFGDTLGDGSAGAFELTIILYLITIIFACVYLLLCTLRMPASFRIWALATSCAFCVLCAGAGALPLFAVVIPACVFFFFRGKNAFLVSLLAAVCAGGLLMSMREAPDAGWDVGVSLLFYGFTAYVLHLLYRREADALLLERRGGELEAAREGIEGQRRASRNVERVTKLEERNRLAARIHDQIGHGMSGSILLLEGAAGIMDRDPKQAKETVAAVAQHLRESVDEIRRVLREERSESAEMSLARVERALAAFEGAHTGFRTAFEPEGDLDAVPQTVWHCVYENLQEALTNMLKHAPKATAFRVRAVNRDRLLRVEFSDNGGAAPGDSGGADGSPGSGAPPAQGIGLQNMEERCALCYGRCFFRREPDGFHIVMTFPLREGGPPTATSSAS